ncbi:MAG: GTP cyclohydrolase I FolE [Candidatus Omnitrophota bacterium]|nr:MAG: GTP cyclohydrolase I FolE [Candidatus Omnitrophota bacterium]
MDKEKIKNAVKLFLEGIGENPNRDELLRTPERVADMCEEIFSGIGKDPEQELTPFFAKNNDQIVLLKNIPFYSLCEHHLLPFFGSAHLAYIPKDDRIAGLSKFIRIIDIYACRMQVQERLTTQIVDLMMKRLKPLGALVVIEARHLCMSMRGVKKNVPVVTSAVRGVFKTNQKARLEALSLLRS